MIKIPKDKRAIIIGRTVKGSVSLFHPFGLLLQFTGLKIKIR